MKTSLNDTQTIELYLAGKLSPWNRMLFASRLRMNPDLRNELQLQKKTYWLVKIYHRKKLREELESLHQQILNNPAKRDFRKRILGIFGKD
jgi:hypothetical protein